MMWRNLAMMTTDRNEAVAQYDAIAIAIITHNEQHIFNYEGSSQAGGGNGNYPAGEMCKHTIFTTTITKKHTNICDAELNLAYQSLLSEVEIFDED